MSEERVCVECKEELPEEASSRRRYCSTDCSREARYFRDSRARLRWLEERLGRRYVARMLADARRICEDDDEPHVEGDLIRALNAGMARDD